MQIKNKTVVITGGGNGIGRELVLAFLKHGCRVAAVDLNEKYLLETQKLAGDQSVNLSLHVVDITDHSAVINLFDEVISRHETVDILINNAGIIQPFVNVKDLSSEKIQKVFKVNFFALLEITKTFLPHLLKRPEAYLVNVSSMGGYLPVPGQSVYGASKAAVKLLTEGLYAELKNTGVHVSIVFPGAIGTNITINSGVEIPESMKDAAIKERAAQTTSPKKAAEIILSGILKNKYRIFVGKDARFMDILYRLSPKYATDFIAKKMKALLH